MTFGVTACLYRGFVVTVSNIELCQPVLIHCDTMRRVRISPGHSLRASKVWPALINSEEQIIKNTQPAKPNVEQKKKKKDVF